MVFSSVCCIHYENRATIRGKITGEKYQKSNDWNGSCVRVERCHSRTHHTCKWRAACTGWAIQCRTGNTCKGGDYTITSYNVPSFINLFSIGTYKRAYEKKVCTCKIRILVQAGAAISRSLPFFRAIIETNICQV